MSRETDSTTIGKAVALCAICSLLVSVAAVSLRGLQEKNKREMKQRNVLDAVGLYEPGKSISELFKQIETQVIDLETGLPAEGIDPDTFDQQKAARDPKLSVAIDPKDDVAGIKRREKYALVYFVKGDSGDFDKVILTVYGKGLWSTMYAYLALENDLQTVAGISYFDQKETPGLGGEVENKNWKASWKGKIAIEEGESVINVVKGLNLESPQAIHQIDALSGATITSNGVENTMKYWLGEHGYGPFLNRLKQSRQGN